MLSRIKRPSEKRTDGERNHRSKDNSGKWSRSEHIAFVKGCLVYGKNYKKIKDFLQTRTVKQIDKHAQAFIKKLIKKFNYDPNEESLEDAYIIKETDRYLDQDKAEMIVLKIFTQNKRMNMAETNEMCAYKAFCQKRKRNDEPEENKQNKEENDF